MFPPTAQMLLLFSVVMFSCFGWVANEDLYFFWEYDDTKKFILKIMKFRGVKYSEIVSVGGDGLFNEVLCGLVRREQKIQGVDCDDSSASLARPKLRIGLIPAGSTNALACTVMGSDDPTTAALHIALGDESGIDVCAVYHERKLLRFASTMVSFGYLGEVLKDSEKMRCLGPLRYRISGFKMMLKHPRFLGRVGLRPVFDDSRPDLERMNLAYRSKKPMKCHSECDVCYRVRSGSIKSADVVSLGRSEGEVYTSHVSEEFNHVVAVITPCLSRMSPDGLSPMSHLGDGTLDLGLVAGIGRCQNAKFMTEAMSKGANHVKRSFVHMFRATRFSYTPAQDLDPNSPENDENGNLSTEQLSPRALNIRGSKRRGKNWNKNPKGTEAEAAYRGTWNVDGEVLAQPQGVLHFRVHRQLIKLFARGIELGDDGNAAGSYPKL